MGDRVFELMMKRIELLEKRVYELEKKPVIDDGPVSPSKAFAALSLSLRRNQKKA